jgi:23S rRNA (guanosine2251-2'-O)-methyltransferase
MHDATYIYGRHPVREALKRVPGAVLHLYAVGEHSDHSILELGKSLGIPCDRCDEDHLPRGVERGVVHQGVCARIAPHKILVPYKQFLESLTVTDATAIVLLDEMTDPHNVGAVIRSAAGFGIAGVLIPEHRQAPVTGTVVKVSAGTAFALPLVQIGNVNTVLRDLKEKGFWVYGLVMDGSTSLSEEKFTKPSVFVLGNESRGLREKTEELCDFSLSIPIDKRCESLNVSVSAGITFYAWATQQGGVTK